MGQQPGGSQGAQPPSLTSGIETIYKRNEAPSQSTTAATVQAGAGRSEGSSTTSTASTTSTTSRKKTPDDEVCYVWQYYTDQGDWRSYPPDIQKRVESEYLKRKSKGSIVIGMGKGSERIIFKSMEQRNVEKQVIRPVRRVEADAEKLRELQEMWSA